MAVSHCAGLSGCAGYSALVIGCLFNGSFGVLHKLVPVSNAVFALYFSIGCFIASELTLPYLALLPDAQITFSPAGLGSGFSAFFAINFVFYTMEKAGVAVSMVGFCGCIILTSTLIENMLILGLEPRHPMLLAGALSLIVLSLVGVFISRRASDKRRRTTISPLEEHLAHLDEVSATLRESEHRLDATHGSQANAGAKRNSNCVSIAFGLCGATLGFVSIKLWGRLTPSIAGIEFTWSFGIGILLSALILSPIVISISQRRLVRVADLGSMRGACIGIASGLLWGVANVTLDVAIGDGIPLGTVNTVFQGAIVVSGLWGVKFGELAGMGPIALFFASSALFLCGIFGVAASTS